MIDKLKYLQQHQKTYIQNVINQQVNICDQIWPFMHIFVLRNIKIHVVITLLQLEVEAWSLHWRSSMQVYSFKQRGTTQDKVNIWETLWIRAVLLKHLPEVPHHLYWFLGVLHGHVKAMQKSRLGNLFCTVLEITVRHQTFSDQNKHLSEYFILAGQNVQIK